jgi:predicted DNA-binding protein (MmcQ/YjbR family)
MPARPNPLVRVRKLIKTIPGTTEVEAWGTATWRAPKMFAMYEHKMHGLDRTAIWIKAASGNNEIMVATDPKRFFIPPYVGAGGWVGVCLDGKVDWDELAELLWDGFRLVASKKLLKEAVEAGTTRKKS